MRPIYPLSQAIGSWQVPETCRRANGSAVNSLNGRLVNCASRNQSQQTQQTVALWKGGAHGTTVGACYGLKCKGHLSAEAPGAAATADRWASAAEDPDFKTQQTTSVPADTNFISRLWQNSASAFLPFSLLTPYSILLLWGSRGVILTVKWMRNHSPFFLEGYYRHSVAFLHGHREADRGKMTMVRFAETRH